MGTGSAMRVGRYEIVGRIGVGGMAEVLLARLRGPHGFERPVVIKRILPHLVLDPQIVDMFLDEARIIANLRHPNLVLIHELGLDGTEPFMSMEYLEGESLSSMCRRLASRGEDLDYALAAQVVAEACAGLHAAHEARSADGRALDIVHRDVSPQNILVTYSGTVHVIDFGIATTADRVSRTEAGTVRGKFEYGAPEQLLARPLSRQTDIFALGVVLFELVTGRRLYKRGSHADTVQAILHEPAPALSSLRPGSPPQLETICARALAKQPEERYATAAEMRRALLSFARAKTDDDPGDALGPLMRDLFADRAAEKREMLGRVRRGDALETLPEVEVDLLVELPTIADPAFTVPTESASSPWSLSSLASKSPLRRWAFSALVAATLLTVGVSSPRLWRSYVAPSGAALLPANGPATPVPPSPSTAAFVPVEPAPSATTPVRPPVDAPSPAPAASGGPSRPARATAPAHPRAQHAAAAASASVSAKAPTLW